MQTQNRWAAKRDFETTPSLPQGYHFVLTESRNARGSP